MNPPAPQEVLDHHSRLREALEALEFKRVVSEPTSNFFGLAELRDFNAAIDETREELDQQTVMMLVASCARRSSAVTVSTEPPIDGYDVTRWRTAFARSRTKQPDELNSATSSRFGRPRRGRFNFSKGSAS